MKEIFEFLLQQFEEKKPVVLVTVVNSHGSAPRKQGAKMLVGEEGILAGTVGGGKVEYTCITKAQDLLTKKENAFEKYKLTPKEAAGLGMVCGGQVEMLFQYLSFETKELFTVINQALTALQNNQAAYLLTALDLDSDQPIIFLAEKSEDTEDFPEKSGVIIYQENEYIAEVLSQPGKVYIFGGGHVSQALVPVLQYLDFYTVVLDDRPEFLTDVLFPAADQRKLVDFENIPATVEITKDDFVISVTRGHLFDFKVAVQLLHSPAYYIGMMGSAHKIAVQKKKLKESGFSQTEIERIYMPIGLSIKAETPPELAISIAGELIKVRAEKNEN
ncbi:XdhC family protein [Enterococcus alishanensis]|uniref:XdhC family protein n=1 Tax=Enterococcus alishanensis TaxID=1303817 RepID=A0ABS6T9V0_9ENTE|nr:XdhC/CoxI family protein [Enterococcus alishanensis]MBV7389674.1 XdhC family protein [Enterococcus alishanensis]